jgi:ABC-2 type transport system ATP-binding protein
LLKLIGGVMTPDEGTIRTSGPVASMLSLGAGFSPILTATENIYMTGAIYGLNRKQINERFDDIVEFAGVGEFLDTPVRHFSSGMRVRLGFSVIREIDSPIVLLDEVLAVGDRSFSHKVFDHIENMRVNGKTLFIVSHRAKNIKKLCSRLLVLERGRLVHDGDVREGVRLYRSQKN